MNLKRPWIVVGTTLALAGFGAGVAVTSGDVELNDRRQAPAIQLAGDGSGGPAQGDDSPESADSPGSSPFESADSGHDSPGDPGFAPVPAPAQVPAAPPVHIADSGGSGDSPAPAKHQGIHSADSSAGSQSADSSD